MSSTVESLDRGVSGTSATLEKMHKLVALGKLDPTIQKIATWIRMSVPQDKRGKTTETADAIFDWTRDHGIFQSDPFQIEKIEHPIEAMRAVIQNRQNGSYTGPGLFIGDCDTYAVFVAALGGVLGFQYAFETAKVDVSRPDEYSHVWTSLLVDGNWYPLDSSTQGAYPGWRPPVAPDLLARWPEHPIEGVIRGSDMNSFNRGLGDNQASPLADVDAAYPKDYISYGIPKDFGSGPGLIPEGNFDDLQLLPPHETQIPDADLQSDMHLLKAAPLVNPSERIQSIDGQPDDHGNPYYNTKGGVPPYYKVQSQFYPPGSRWNGQIGHDIVRYVKTGPYVQVKSAESPERQVRTNMGQPMTIRRRSVMVTPRQIPYGAMEGMGAIDPVTGIMTLDDTPTDVPSVPTPSQGARPRGRGRSGRAALDGRSDGHLVQPDHAEADSGRELDTAGGCGGLRGILGLGLDLGRLQSRRNDRSGRDAVEPDAVRHLGDEQARREERPRARIGGPLVPESGHARRARPGRGRRLLRLLEVPPRQPSEPPSLVEHEPHHLRPETRSERYGRRHVVDHRCGGRVDDARDPADHGQRRPADARRLHGDRHRRGGVHRDVVRTALGARRERNPPEPSSSTEA